MSELLSGAEVSWDAVSGPVEKRAPAPTHDEVMEAVRVQREAMMTVGQAAVRVFEVTRREIVAASRSIVTATTGAAVAVRRDLLDGDHPGRDEIRAGVTVAQLQALAPFADRGES